MITRYLPAALASLVLSVSFALPGLAVRSSGRIKPAPVIAATELAQIWQSWDCRAKFELVATVSADVVAEEVEKYRGCTRIEYLMDNSDQADASIGNRLSFFTPPTDKPLPRRATGGSSRLM